jgi:hypothetical protein
VLPPSSPVRSLPLPSSPARPESPSLDNYIKRVPPVPPPSSAWSFQPTSPQQSSNNTALKRKSLKVLPKKEYFNSISPTQMIHLMDDVIGLTMSKYLVILKKLDPCDQTTWFKIPVN